MASMFMDAFAESANIVQHCNKCKSAKCQNEIRQGLEHVTCAYIRQEFEHIIENTQKNIYNMQIYDRNLNTLKTRQKHISQPKD